MSNRPEDLESQVAELQAAVDGLTEELVETKERVRQLEETTESLEDASAETSGGAGSNGEGRSTAEEQAHARGTDERRDAEFVANRDAGEATASDPEPAAEEPVDETADESDDDDGDDIIVA